MISTTFQIELFDVLAITTFLGRYQLMIGVGVTYESFEKEENSKQDLKKLL